MRRLRLGFLRAARVAICAAVGIAVCAAGCAARRPGPPGAAEGDGDTSDDEPWLTRRTRPTTLSRRGPASAAETLALPTGMEQVHYPSSTRDGQLALLAVVAAPRRAPETDGTLAERQPAVMLLHPGVALASEHLTWAAPFVDAGLVVMFPTWRGENGNPGTFELLAGEVDDAKAAGRWLASQPDVDIDALSVFGHAEGGALAALLALDPDVPFRRIAASSGVTTAATFPRWQREDARRVPFLAHDPVEQRLRALLPNAAELVHPLLLYVGEDDGPQLRDARLVKERAPTRVELVMVAGDHDSAVNTALARFLALVIGDAAVPVAAVPVAADPHPDPRSNPLPLGAD